MKSPFSSIEKTTTPSRKNQNRQQQKRHPKKRAPKLRAPGRLVPAVAGAARVDHALSAGIPSPARLGPFTGAEDIG